MTAGRIKEILIPEGTTRTEGALVTIEGFELGEHLHPDFEMPILTRSVPERWHTVKSQVSSFICSYNGGNIDKDLKEFTVSVFSGA